MKMFDDDFLRLPCLVRSALSFVSPAAAEAAAEFADACRSSVAPRALPWLTIAFTA
jgi:hypothetical protein